MKKRWPALALAVLLAALPLAGCGGSGEIPVDAEVSSVPASSAEESSEACSEPEQAVVRNPLTGEPGYDEALLSRRPAAVMINNIRASLPQRGIAEAELVYELPVEGAITRLMAVFSDPAGVPDVGSVRSARHDFVELAKPLNAIYVHFGGSDAGFDSIRENAVDNLNGIQLAKNAFYFDDERHRTKATEHCWFTSGELIAAGIAKQGYVAEGTVPQVFRFAQSGEAAFDPAAQTAAAVTAPLSGEVTATFTYEPDSGLYRKGQYGQEHLDEGKGEPVRLRNVFLLYPEVGFLADGLHKDVTLESGEGWYLSGGKAERITFEKKGPGELMRFFHAQGERAGQELEVSAGRSWVCIAPDSYLEKLRFGE